MLCNWRCFLPFPGALVLLFFAPLLHASLLHGYGFITPRTDKNSFTDSLTFHSSFKLMEETSSFFSAAVSSSSSVSSSSPFHRPSLSFSNAPKFFPISSQAKKGEATDSASRKESKPYSDKLQKYIKEYQLIKEEEEGSQKKKKTSKGKSKKNKIEGDTREVEIYEEATHLSDLLATVFDEIMINKEMEGRSKKMLLFPNVKLLTENSDLYMSAKLQDHLETCKDVCEILGQKLNIAIYHPHCSSFYAPVPGIELFPVNIHGDKKEKGDAKQKDGEAGEEQFDHDPFWDDDNEDDADILAKYGVSASDDEGEDGVVDGMSKYEEGGSSTKAPTIPDSDKELIDTSKAWVEAVIADLGVCPFTTNANKGGLPIGNVRYTVTRGKVTEEIYRDYWKEVSLVVKSTDLSGQRNLSTTLMITPDFGLTNREYFETFSNTLTQPLEGMKLEDDIQLVFFHPEYVFRDGIDRLGDGGAGNYARRSPWPMINILRTNQVRVAQKALPTGLVYKQNEVTLNEIGSAKLEDWLQNRNWQDVHKFHRVDRKSNPVLETAQKLTDEYIAKGNPLLVDPELENISISEGVLSKVTNTILEKEKEQKSQKKEEKTERGSKTAKKKELSKENEDDQQQENEVHKNEISSKGEGEGEVEVEDEDKATDEDEKLSELEVNSRVDCQDTNDNNTDDDNALNINFKKTEFDEDNGPKVRFNTESGEEVDSKLSSNAANKKTLNSPKQPTAIEEVPGQNLSYLESLHNNPVKNNQIIAQSRNSRERWERDDRRDRKQRIREIEAENLENCHNDMNTVIPHVDLEISDREKMEKWKDEKMDSNFEKEEINFAAESEGDYDHIEEDYNNDDFFEDESNPEDEKMEDNDDWDSYDDNVNEYVEVYDEESDWLGLGGKKKVPANSKTSSDSPNRDVKEIQHDCRIVNRILRQRLGQKKPLLKSEFIEFREASRRLLNDYE